MIQGNSHRVHQPYPFLPQPSVGRGHCRAARLGLQFFHLPQGAVAIEAIGGLALGSTGG